MHAIFLEEIDCRHSTLTFLLKFERWMFSPLPGSGETQVPLCGEIWWSCVWLSLHKGSSQAETELVHHLWHQVPQPSGVHCHCVWSLSVWHGLLLAASSLFWLTATGLQSKEKGQTELEIRIKLITNRSVHIYVCLLMEWITSVYVLYLVTTVILLNWLMFGWMVVKQTSIKWS